MSSHAAAPSAPRSETQTLESGRGVCWNSNRAYAIRSRRKVASAHFRAVRGRRGITERILMKRERRSRLAFDVRAAVSPALWNSPRGIGRYCVVAARSTLATDVENVQPSLDVGQ